MSFDTSNNIPDRMGCVENRFTTESKFIGFTDEGRVFATVTHKVKFNLPPDDPLYREYT